MSLKSTSKFISLILRHKPETIGITLDEHGWADVDALIEGISRTQPFDREMLEEIVATDEKGRYTIFLICQRHLVSKGSAGQVSGKHRVGLNKRRRRAFGRMGITLRFRGSEQVLKLRFSMTLFAEAAETDEDRNIFLKVLDKFFDGKKDTRTLAILRQIGE